MSPQKNPSDETAARPASLADLVMANIEDGVVLVDSAGKITAFNPAAGLIAKIKPEAALSRDWQEVIKLADRHSVGLEGDRNPILRAIRGGRSVREKDSWLLAGGRKIPIHLIATPLADSDQHGQEIVLVMREMSQEKAAEETKTDFVSTASHEMRTPLAALEGYLALILEQPLDQKTAEYAQKAHQSVLHLGKLFHNLLTTTQSEDGRLSHSPRLFELDELMEQVVAGHKMQAEAKKISLFFNPGETDDGGSWQLEADPARIHELLSNVLDNAIKYTDPGGEINICRQRLKNCVQIEIADSGCGIPAPDLPHLFQKFYRVGGDQPGAGLGLFICKKIVELYGGDIWLESEPGRGSVFFVNLPLAENG